MITILPADERGVTEFGWLDSRHTFSFGDYHDPEHMGFRTLRVINDDRVRPGQGFGMHPHRDMEILTWVLEGALEHKDSMGNGSIIEPGEIQVMSAGTGVLHSEFNPSDTQPVRLLQIWILPERRGLMPRYDQRSFPDEELRGRVRPIVTPDMRDGSVLIHQDVSVYAARLDPDQGTLLEIAPGRHAWAQVAKGALELNGRKLQEGDGAAVSDEPRLEIRAAAPSELLVFDLA
jgi:hypothetical protein